MNKETIINILVGLGVLIIIVLVTSVILTNMGERINYDCSKQNWTGIVHYWDADIDCDKLDYALREQVGELV